MSQQIIRAIVRGAYDIQKLRIQTGNRIAGNFKAKLGQQPGSKEVDLEKEAQKILQLIRKSYERITDGIVEGNIKPKTFKGDELISTFTEFCLVEQYMRELKNEEAHFKRLGYVLADFPVYEKFLKKVKGIGPAMAGVIVSEIDIHRSLYPSSLYVYAGLDCAPDGSGRTRKAEHLRNYEYASKETGEIKTKKGITFNPFLKTKLVGVLGSSFLRSGGDYSKIYYDYKNRLENHPDHKDKTKLHKHNMSIRYMIKQFLRDLYANWRAIEKLPVHPPYHEAKLGIVHRKAS